MSERDWFGLSEDEREFLRNHEGGLGAILASIGTDAPRGAIGAAEVAANAAIEQLAERYPNRVERLLALSAIMSAAADARDLLLTELLEGSFHWTYSDEDAGGHYTGWGGIAFQPTDLQRLADVAGMSIQALRSRFRKAQTATLHRAMAEAGQPIPDEPS